MAQQQWYRQYCEFATDPKVQSMSEAMQRRFIMLLCLKGNGDLDKLSFDELAFALRIDGETLRVTLDLFFEKGFCDKDGNLINWDKRQYISDKKDPTAADRVRRYREKKKLHRNNSVTLRLPETDTETDTDTEKGKEVIPPTPFGGVEAVAEPPPPEPVEPPPPAKEDIFTQMVRETLDEIWEIYPKKRIGDRDKARIALRRALKEKQASAADIIIGARRYAASDEVGRGFAKGLAAWLNDSRWTVEYEPYRGENNGRAAGNKGRGAGLKQALFETLERHGAVPDGWPVQGSESRNIRDDVPLLQHDGDLRQG